MRSIPRWASICAPVARRVWPESRSVRSLFIFSCPDRSAPATIVCTTAVLDTALPPKVGKRGKEGEG